MQLTATASKTVRNKNLIMIVLCSAFTLWFAYDGFIGYPQQNDKLVAHMKEMAAKNDVLTVEDEPLLNQWPAGGWSEASPELRAKLNVLVTTKHFEGWKTATDIAVQRGCVLLLVLSSIAAIWWLFRCQGRRITADDQALSPSPGISIPWTNITKVDNTRWKKTGIVDIEYKNSQGSTQSAELDDYLLDNLVPILEELSHRATKAEFINPPEEEPAAK